jgi:regulator of nucleoside diphosphate kinase
MMPQKSELKASQKPNITLLAADYERLSALADAAMYKDPETAKMLGEELGRARIVIRAQAPQNYVRMGSDVLFRNDITKETRRVVLVFPSEANISENKISILTPVGAALIGLRAGQSITWRARSDEVKRLTVLKVKNPQAPVIDHLVCREPLSPA